MKRRWRKLGRGQGRKGKRIRPKGRGGRTNNGRRRSLWRRTRAHGKRARALEGRKGRKTGGEVRSGKNAVIKVTRELLQQFVAEQSPFLGGEGGRKVKGMRPGGLDDKNHWSFLASTRTNHFWLPELVPWFLLLLRFNWKNGDSRNSCSLKGCGHGRHDDVTKSWSTCVRL